MTAINLGLSDNSQKTRAQLRIAVDDMQLVGMNVSGRGFLHLNLDAVGYIEQVSGDAIIHLTGGEEIVWQGKKAGELADELQEMNNRHKKKYG